MTILNLGEDFILVDILWIILLDMRPVNERICKTRFKTQNFNLTEISTHAPNEEKVEVVKEEFYSSLEKECDAVRNHDMQTALGDFNVKDGKDSYLRVYPAYGGQCL